MCNPAYEGCYASCLLIQLFIFIFLMQSYVVSIEWYVVTIWYISQRKMPK